MRFEPLQILMSPVTVPTFQNSSAAKSVEILYLFFHSPTSVPAAVCIPAAGHLTTTRCASTVSSTGYGKHIIVLTTFKSTYEPLHILQHTYETLEQ